MARLAKDRGLAQHRGGRDDAAQRQADDMRGASAAVLHDGEEIVGEIVDRIRRRRGRGASVPARVEAEDAIARRERRHLRLPHREIGGERVEQHDPWASLAVAAHEQLGCCRSGRFVRSPSPQLRSNSAPKPGTGSLMPLWRSACQRGRLVARDDGLAEVALQERDHLGDAHLRAGEEIGVGLGIAPFDRAAVPGERLDRAEILGVGELRRVIAQHRDAVGAQKRRLARIHRRNIRRHHDDVARAHALQRCRHRSARHRDGKAGRRHDALADRSAPCRASRS